MTIHAAPGMGIVEHAGQGDTHLPAFTIASLQPVRLEDAAITPARKVMVRGNRFVERDPATPGETGAAFGIDQSAVHLDAMAHDAMMLL